MAEFLLDSQRDGATGTNGGGEAKEPIQGHLATSSTNNRLYSETLKEFADWFFSASPEEYDEELLDAYLEEMDTLSPMECSFDSQTSLEKFHERFPSFFDEQRDTPITESNKSQAVHLPRSIRKLGIVAAIVVGIFGMLVTAQAAGIDVLGAIGRWTEETFHFVSTPLGNEQETITAESNPTYSECRKLLQAALDECEIEKDLIPEWCPERFQPSKPTISTTSRCRRICVSFLTSEEEGFSLVITRYQTPEDLDYLTFEKDNSSIEQYTTGSMLFYILSNNNTITATWSDGLLVERIMGNLSKKEVKAILNSIGGAN